MNILSKHIENIGNQVDIAYAAHRRTRDYTELQCLAPVRKREYDAVWNAWIVAIHYERELLNERE